MGVVYKMNNEEVVGYRINILRSLQRLLKIKYISIVLLSALICSLAFGFYVQKKENSRNKPVEQTYRSDEEAVTVLAEKLDEDELKKIDFIVQRVNMQKTLRDYCFNSPIMQIDAYDAKLVRISYFCIGEKGLAPYIVSEVFANTIQSDKFLEKICDNIGMKDRSKTIRELFRVSSSVMDADDLTRVIIESAEDENSELIGEIVYLNVYLTDDINDVELVDTVKNTVNNLDLEYDGKSLKELVKYGGSYALTGSFPEIFTVQNNYLNAYSTNAQRIKALKDELNDTESTYLTYLLKTQRLNIDGTEYIPQVNEANSQIEDVDVQYLSRKGIVIGFVGGAAISIITILIIWYVFPKVGRITGLSELSEYPVLGVISTKKMTNQTTIDTLSQHIEFHRGKEPLNIEFLAIGNDDNIKEMVCRIKERLHISEDAVSYSRIRSFEVEGNDEMFSVVESLEGKITILILEYEKIGFEKIRELCSMLKEKKVVILGSIGVIR